MRRLLLASSAAGLASCDQFSVSTTGHSEHERLDDDALDLAAYEAIRDDNLEAAVAAFASAPGVITYVTGRSRRLCPVVPSRSCHPMA